MRWTMSRNAVTNRGFNEKKKKNVYGTWLFLVKCNLLSFFELCWMNCGFYQNSNTLLVHFLIQTSIIILLDVYSPHYNNKKKNKKEKENNKLIKIIFLL